MRYLSIGEILELHRRIIERSGGASAIRDLGTLETACAQPRMTYAGEELYPDLAAKAAALAFFLVKDHPFVDGNKRVGHAVMETFLLLNGHELGATVDDTEATMLALAAGELDREGFTDWVRGVLGPLE